MSQYVHDPNDGIQDDAKGTFLDSCKQVRREFTKVFVRDIDANRDTLDLRTKVDTLLIMYDQLMDKHTDTPASLTPELVERIVEVIRKLNPSSQFLDDGMYVSINDVRAALTELAGEGNG